MLRIFESRGVAEPSLIFVNFILNEFRLKLEYLLNSSNKEINLSKEYGEKDLYLLMNNWHWKDFPVSSLEIKFVIKKMEDGEFLKKFPGREGKRVKMFRTGGACYNIMNKEEGGSYIKVDEWGDKTLHLSLELDLWIRGDFSEIDKIMIDMESTILHELNHGYESWNRHKKGKGELSTELTYALDVKPNRMNKDVFKYWNSTIAMYLYWSEEHEIRAMVQEALPYVKNYKIEKMKEESPSWEASSLMINFKSKEFKSEISYLIKSKYGNKVNPDALLNRIKNSLGDELIRERELSKSMKIDKPSILGERIKSMSLEKFLDFSQRRINASGDNLRKRILRLYSLKNNDTNEIIF